MTNQDVADELQYAIDLIKQDGKEKTWTTEEVAELLFNMFGDDCACNFNNIDEWLPESCAYRETTCPDPKEKHGCWVQFLLQGGGSTSEEGHDKRRSNTVD